MKSNASQNDFARIAGQGAAQAAKAGQSGNPGSRGYDAFVQDWLAGRAYRLLFLKNPLEFPDSTDYLLALRGHP